MTLPPIIRSQHLVLTPLRAEDAATMFAYRSQPEICRYQSFEPSNLADVEAFIGRVQLAVWNSPGTWYQLGIRTQSTGTLVGDLGIHFLDPDALQVEIGVTIATGHQRNGYASEAFTAALNELLGPMGKHRARASVDPRNAASMALLKRVGMRQEAHFRRSLWFKGEWVDDVIFALLAAEWGGG